MKLVSLLRCIDDEDDVNIIDYNASISNCCLFFGKAKDAIKVGRIRNGLVYSILADDEILTIIVDIEFQKKIKDKRRCDQK